MIDHKYWKYENTGTNYDNVKNMLYWILYEKQEIILMFEETKDRLEERFE